MPLRSLYVDMNCYFASVEQQLRPELRGRPIGVAAIDVPTTCCIAASVEAKRLGIKTGTPLWRAREICPEFKVVRARPQVYVEMHEKIREAVESCIPVAGVHSIDEMSCLLFPAEADPPATIELVRRIKQAIRRSVGEVVTCSVGIAPNVLLAKVAADMQKPDGMTFIHDHDLPHKLFSLKLDDLPGIGPRMFKRLNSRGVGSIEALCSLSESKLRELWGGIVGERWWYRLRGYDVAEPKTRRSSCGHSHVLPPDFRTMDGARAVLIRLIHKVGARLRKMSYWARRLDVHLSFMNQDRGSGESVLLGECQDTSTMIEAFNAIWNRSPRNLIPLKVSITLSDLLQNSSASEPLFMPERRRVSLSRTLDQLNARFGRDTVYFGEMHGMKGVAPTRIAFNHIPVFNI